MNLIKITNNIWEVPVGYTEGMRVPGRIYASEKLMGKVETDAIKQNANVATLPGILKYSIAMPEIHVGYGFPIGGIAGLDETDGVISPGGVGFDINCGVRLLATKIPIKDLLPRLNRLVEEIFKEIPSGVGSTGKLRLDTTELKKVFESGARWAVSNGYGTEKDLNFCEENGCMKDASPDKVSKKAINRGLPQLGTLGSGNHFLEIGCIDEIYDPDAAKVFGLEKGMTTVMIHTGSRGAGHQICTDQLEILVNAVKKYGISLPDRQLACAPLGSKDAEEYYGVMSAAANYAWANRQIITHWMREVFDKILGDGDLKIVYDVAHNIAKIEEHVVDGKRKKVIVHRKGATRAFPKNSKDIPAEYRSIGQPVLIPGSMGTFSYVLKGTDKAMEETFGSTCHGAGRVLSRSSAKRKYRGENVKKELKDHGIIAKAVTDSVLAEEAPLAYKSSDDIVDVVDSVGISKKVAKIRPYGVVKG